MKNLVKHTPKCVHKENKFIDCGCKCHKYWKYNPLTRIRILEFIRNYGEKSHKSPTMEEIGKGVGLHSLSSVWYQLENMGFADNKGSWRKNKKEFMSQWKCPTCLRDLYGETRIK